MPWAIGMPSWRRGGLEMAHGVRMYPERDTKSRGDEISLQYHVTRDITPPKGVVSHSTFSLAREQVSDQVGEGWCSDIPEGRALWEGSS